MATCRPMDHLRMISTRIILFLEINDSLMILCVLRQTKTMYNEYSIQLIESWVGSPICPYYLSCSILLFVISSNTDGLGPHMEMTTPESYLQMPRPVQRQEAADAIGHHVGVRGIFWLGASSARRFRLLSSVPRLQRALVVGWKQTDAMLLALYTCYFLAYTPLSLVQDVSLRRIAA